MVERLACYHSLVPAVIPNELLNFHPADCELNGFISHCQNLKPGRASGIVNGSGARGNVPRIQHSQDLSFNLGFGLLVLVSTASVSGFAGCSTSTEASQYRQNKVPFLNDVYLSLLSILSIGSDISLIGPSTRERPLPTSLFNIL
jgi:hypothetical protein